MGTEVLLAIDDADRLAEFARCLAIRESPDGFSCMCLGSLAIEAVDKDDRTIGVIGFHHASSISWAEKWDFDAVLEDGPAAVRFLESSGVAGPANELRAAQERRVQSDRDLASWLAGAPAGIRELAGEIAEAYRSSMRPASLIDDLRSKLLDLYPSSNDRVRALLGWFGSSVSKGPGTPVHETVPGDLLLEYSTDSLIAGLDELDRDVLGGGLRLFAGWGFRERTSELRSLPDSLVQALEHEANLSSDDGQRRRAAQLIDQLKA